MSWQLGIERKPILPVIKITKNNGTQYEFNHFTEKYDFRLRMLTAEPAIDNVGGKFKIKLTSENATNTNTNTILSNIEEGNEVEIWIGKDNSSKEKIFLGTVDEVEITEPSRNYMDVMVSGPDWGSDILKNRVVNGAWVQAKQADGITLDQTDNNVLISNVVQDLLNKPGSYPTNDVTVANQGIIVNSSNIDVPTIRLSSFITNYEFLDDKLSEIDAIGGTRHYVDPDKSFIMHQPLVSSSAVPAEFLIVDDFTDSVAQGWNQDKLGLIGPGSKILRTTENSKRRLFGLGGDQLSIDQKQETNSGNDSLEVVYIAQKITPKFRNLDTIGVYVNKNGTPQISLDCEIIEDQGGEPEGTILRSMSEHQDRITSSPGWIYFKMGVELNTSKDYWILLSKTAGGDASNHFNWYHNNGSSHTNATSTDAETWIVNSNSKGYMFRQYTSSPVLSTLSDNTSPVNTKHYHEIVINKPDITEVELMTQMLFGESTNMFKKKQIFSCRVYAPNSLLKVGQKIRVRKQSSGFVMDSATDGNGDFVIGGLKYSFQSEKSLATGTFWYDMQCARFVPWN